MCMSLYSISVVVDDNSEEMDVWAGGEKQFRN